MSNRVDASALRRAEKVLRANLSPRYYRLDTLERYVDGAQYEGKASFFDDSVPLLDRAPRIVYLIARDAIRSNVDLVLGEGRFPTITSLPGEDDEEDVLDADDDGLGLDEEASAVVDRGVRSILKQSRGKTVFREALEAAQGCGTAVVIAGVRNGKICLETTQAKWCTPTFDPQDPERITQVEIRYPYLQETYSRDRKKWTVDVLLYRRVIDEEADTTYAPARANENGEEPDSWQVAHGGRVEHGLGFCPVRWYKFASKCCAVSEVDGRAVHALLLDEIDALNFSLSQHDRAALYAGDPQMVETGVDEDVHPAPMGQQAFGAFNSPLGGSGQEPDRGSWQSPGVQKAAVGTAGVGRKKGPGVIYRYPSEKSKLTLLTLPGDALKSVDENSKKLLSMLREALAYVATDPEQMKLNGDISGRFLEWLYRKQLNRCDDIRLDFGDKCLLPVVDMLLRVVLVKADGIRMRGVRQLAEVLSRFEREAADGDAATQWVSPELHIRWPPYFQPTEADQKAIGESVRADLEAGVITRLTAVEKLAPFYGIESAAEYVEKLEQEAADKMSKMHEAAEVLGKVGAPESDDEAQAGDSALSMPKVKKVVAPKPKTPKAPPAPKPARKASRRRPQPQLDA